MSPFQAEGPLIFELLSGTLDPSKLHNSELEVFPKAGKVSQSFSQSFSANQDRLCKSFLVLFQNHFTFYFKVLSIDTYALNGYFHPLGEGAEQRKVTCMEKIKFISFSGQLVALSVFLLFLLPPFLWLLISDYGVVNRFSLIL